MNIWRIYEYLVQVVHPFMVETDECLYNGLVRKQAEQTDAYLLEVRDSALNIVKMIEEELADRQADRADREADCDCVMNAGLLMERVRGCAREHGMR